MATELRPKYHNRTTRSDSRSVALTAESYELLKSKADELDVTIKSLLAVLIERHIDSFDPDPSDERIGG